MMHADGWRNSSAAGTFFCSSFASAALLVFRGDPSTVDSAQGRGPKGWQKTSVMWSCLFSAVITIWPKRALSAFRMILFPVLLLNFTFFFSSENIFSFHFFRVSWNLTGGFASRRYARNSLYAFSPIAFGPNKPFSIFWVGGTLSGWQTNQILLLSTEWAIRRLWRYISPQPAGKFKSRSIDGDFTTVVTVLR